jgi:hypothetical protein
MMLRTPLLQPPSDAACRQGAIQTGAPVDPALLFRDQDRAATKFSRLGDLPKANLEIAVERTVGGCAAPIVVRANVGP